MFSIPDEEIAAIFSPDNELFFCKSQMIAETNSLSQPYPFYSKEYPWLCIKSDYISEISSSKISIIQLISKLVISRRNTAGMNFQCAEEIHFLNHSPRCTLD